MYRKRKVWFLEIDGKNHVVVFDEKITEDRALVLFKRKLEKDNGAIQQVRSEHEG